MTRHHFPICVRPLLLRAQPRLTSLWWVDLSCSSKSPGVLPLTSPHTGPSFSHSSDPKSFPCPRHHLTSGPLCRPYLTPQCSSSPSNPGLPHCPCEPAAPVSRQRGFPQAWHWSLPSPRLFLALPHFRVPLQQACVTRDRNFVSHSAVSPVLRTASICGIKLRIKKGNI